VAGSKEAGSRKAIAKKFEDYGSSAEKLSEEQILAELGKHNQATISGEYLEKLALLKLLAMAWRQHLSDLENDGHSLDELPDNP